MVQNKPPVHPVQYDQIAPTYDQRYNANPLEGVAKALSSLAISLKAAQLLEVGCGTGRWLAELQATSRQVYGLDLSLGMLMKARRKDAGFYLVCGQASRLPFPAASIDLIFCVNAFHHFTHPGLFINDARRLLRHGGGLAILGMDPHTGQDNFYLYDYFAKTLQADQNRFPSGGRILDWMTAAGFERVERRPVERIVHEFVGREVLDDPFLQKNSTSQLILLTDEAYADGLRLIEKTLTEAEEKGKRVTFPVNITLFKVSGFV